MAVRKRNQRGLDAHQEQNYKNIIRDTRPLAVVLPIFGAPPKALRLL